MALLDEAGCDPTCGELMLRAPEATEEEFSRADRQMASGAP
jgi:hypothetical protein